MKLNPLDKLFSEYIRKRAMQRVHGCERCLAGKTSHLQLQCSHFHGRSKKAVRYDEDNAAGLCAGCHMHLTSHPLEHTEWFRGYLGEEKFNLLNSRVRISGIDENAIGVYYKQKLKEPIWGGER